MEDLSCTPTHFALLIGVNSDSERLLKGSEDPFIRSNIVDRLESSATYSNIRTGLHAILSIAQPGSYVYIYYSGHGVRMGGSSEFSNKATGDLALNVLDDSSQIVTRPFPGLELAEILGQMVSKGLLVTLVLDCCFSGSVLRDPTSERLLVRYREFWHTLPDITPRLLEEDIEVEDTEDYNGEKRDISMLLSWLVDPKGYTIITACGPYEVALELNLGGETSDHRHGVLSYFLLRAMKKLGGLGGRHAYIYPYLCSLFRQFRPTQNPMWYGNKDLYFFGNATLSLEVMGSPFSVIWNGDLLQLQGGQAHGICEGDQFAVYTINSGRTLVTGRVKELRPLTSDLEIQDASSIWHQDGNTFHPGTVINAMDGSRLRLTIENTGFIDLYLHVYNLGPLGQVTNIQSASYSVLPRRNLAEGFAGEVTLKFRARLPSKVLQRGIFSCEDTIKVFLTSIPTSFASLEMQDLDDFQDRGPVEPVDGYRPSTEQEDWVSLSFTICTVQQQCPEPRLYKGGNRKHKAQ
ncbi:hypothetical protein NPX13_g5092 [Xylaria arbuscula]|uniref:Peptidase C14 caspase domain-containing protein n=1 Tax=Xylaria arbuscula TaxID=114810 RepID=A0A9W8NE97_9PEZI|nr:hypothetical protein NPX13_g5092 [Xylaria arbuscula]